MLTRQSIENFTKLLYKSKFLVEIYSIYLVNCKLFKWKLLRTEVARYVYLSKANDLNNQTPFNAYTLPAADITKKNQSLSFITLKSCSNITVTPSTNI